MRVILWFGLIILLLCLAAVVFREALTETALKRYCRVNGIYCQIDITALTPSGMSAADMSLADDAGEELLALDSVNLELEWRDLFSPAPTSISADGLSIVLDLRAGQGSLDRLIELAPKGAADGPGPQVEIKDMHIALKTEAGDVDVDASLHVRSQTDVEARFEAAPTSLSLGDRRLKFSSARGSYTVRGGDATGEIFVLVDDMHLPEGDAREASLDISLNKSGGPLELVVNADAAMFETQSGAISDAVLELKALLDRPEFPMISRRSLIKAVQELDISARTGEGRWDKHAWSGGVLSLSSSQSERADQTTGKVHLHLDAYSRERTYRVDQLEARGRLVMGEGRNAPAWRLDDGRLELAGAGISKDAPWREVLEQASRKAPGPLADSVDRALTSMATAMNSFDLPVNVHAEISRDGEFSINSVGAVSVRAANGVTAVMSEGSGPVLRWREGEGFSAAGEVQMKAWPLELDAVAFSADVGTTRYGAGGLNLALISDETDLQLTLADLLYQGGPDPYFNSDFGLEFDGEAFGAQWRGVSASGALKGDRAGRRWSIAAPEGLDLGIDRLTINQTQLSQISTQYQPDGALMRLDAEGAHGEGRLSSVRTRLTIGGRFYDIDFDGAQIDWGLEKSLMADLDLVNASLGLPLGESWFRMEAPRATAQILGADHWRVSGDFSGAEGSYDPVMLSDVEGRFLLEGEENGLTGSVDPISFRMKDKAASARFAASDFFGSMVLSGGELEGEGAFTHPVVKQILARTKFRHDLKTGRGDAALTSTWLRFSPDGLQPAMIFPVLQGIVASVEGPVVMSGNAGWGGGAMTTSAALELTDISFSTEKAGLFEGVFGRIELTDLFKVKSEPGQTVTIHQWDPGVPIKDGTVSFQLDGLKALAVESVRFPFAGGVLNARPTIWKIHDRQNEVVVDVENIDLETLLKRFGLDNIEAKGVLSGAAPVSFSTGSVIVDDAQLTSSAGWFGYKGDPPEDLDRRNETLRLFFDALQDFSYTLLDLRLAGDIAGDMTLHLTLEGHNPAVLDGYPFALQMELTADLMSLFNRSSLADRAVEQIRSALAGLGRSSSGGQLEQDSFVLQPHTGETR